MDVGRQEMIHPVTISVNSPVSADVISPPFSGTPQSLGLPGTGHRILGHGRVV